MTDVFLHVWADGERPLDFVEGALGRLGIETTFGLRVAHFAITQGDFLDGRAPWPVLDGSLDRNGEISWGESSTMETIRRLRGHDEPGLQGYIDFALRPSREPVPPASFDVYGSEYVRRFPRSPVRLFLDNEEAFPPGMNASELDALLLNLVAGGTHGGARAVVMAYEGNDENPFNAYAVTTSDIEQTLATDFARGWLSRHTNVRIPALVLASKEEVRRALWESAETRAPKSVSNHYDGSLSKVDVLRILETPASEIVAALEKACASTSGSGNARSPFAPGAGLRGDFEPRVKRLPGGGLLLGAGPFQPLWRLYQAAAALLVR